ncbi:pregnancy zone [Pelobates cultripes]|uniref:Pregnancy zone n=1 Tax=Pelobates cultripes TaxID=61616 RepID=A0AAD1TFU5_PELCU|nr:pregnancy zone [Pelobates cultripes]
MGGQLIDQGSQLNRNFQVVLLEYMPEKSPVLGAVDQLTNMEQTGKLDDNECDSFVSVTLEVKERKVLSIHYERKSMDFDSRCDTEIDFILVEFHLSCSTSRWRISNGVVVQTDKPTYRPSQTVLFRILTLNEKFFTAKNQLSKRYHVVELKDSKSNRIAQWLDIKTNSGIVDLSFNLTSEPLLGTYTINVDNGQTLKTFIVQEEESYKYEGNGKGPSIHVMLDKDLNRNPCGSYHCIPPLFFLLADGFHRLFMCRAVLDAGESLDPLSGGVNGGSGPAMFQAYAATNIFIFKRVGVAHRRFTRINRTVRGDGISVIGEKKGVSEKTKRYTQMIFASPLKVNFRSQSSLSWLGMVIRDALMEEDGSGLFQSPCNLQQTSMIIMGTDRCPFISCIVQNGLSTIQIRVKISSDKQIPISFNAGTLKFQDMDTYYKVGHPYSITLVVLNRDGTMGFYKTLYATEAQSFLRMDPIFSVILCDKRVNIRVTYELSLRDLRDYRLIKMHWTIIGRTGILVSGQRSIFLTKADPVKGAFYLPIIFTSDFGPAPKMIGYILLNNGTMTADRLRFKTETCFPNKVNLKFPVREAVPKTLLNLHMEASADSVCGLRVVDKSVQISYTDQELTADKVYSLFQFSDRSGYDSRIDEINSLSCWKRYPWTFDRMLNGNTQFTDILSLFRDPGNIFPHALVGNMGTTFHMKRAQGLDAKLYFFMVQEVQFVEAPQIKYDSIPAPENNVREDFPETWLWELVEQSKMGKASLNVRVPDTITDWSAGIFCTGPSGFGLSAPTYVRAFQPFFVEMSLPYSVVLGELFTLKASVFNYLDDCATKAIGLKNSYAMVLRRTPDRPQGGGHSPKAAGASPQLCWVRRYWEVSCCWGKETGLSIPAATPATLDGVGAYGDILFPLTTLNDHMHKQLLIQTEGAVKQDTISTVLLGLSIRSSEKILGSFSVLLPDIVVENSVSAYIYVMGDLLGSSLQNLDNLLQMPYGCGEQNMLTTSTIVYVLQYLEATGQLTAEVRSKATSYLQSGYQRELNYKHSDGSYSAFGESDGEGSTWLTAFVVKCFSQGKLYIFIDEDLINKAVTWLGTLQQNDGCFKSVRIMFNAGSMGGVEDDVSLSAYITAALLEMGIPPINIILANALNCVRNKVPNLTNPYTQALLAYAFTLANDLTNRAILLNNLYQVAILSVDETHWEYALQSSGSEGGVSASVELSSYILLALVSGSDVTTEDIEKASRIVRWLIKQQNPSGGFSSTQDTVVAIQALSKYLRVTFRDQMNVLVNVSDKKGFQKRFQVNSQNRLLQQSETLPRVPGEYSLIVTGYGCVYIKSVLKYNMYPKASHLTFDLKVAVYHTQCNSQGLEQLRLAILVSYTGSRNASNMVLIQVELLSGFSPGEDTAALLQNMPEVKKVSITPNSVTIYLEKLTNIVQTYSIDIVQNLVVMNLKPAVVKVFDYYFPEENSVTSYTMISLCSNKLTNENVKIDRLVGAV